MEKILTIVIPTYNMQDYLRRCLDSLIVPEEQINQLEVLVVNDGSKDNSSVIAHEYQSKYPETFRVIDKENGNYGSCINRGLKEAAGKYIKVLDADDYYDNVAFAQLLKQLCVCDTDLVITPCDIVNQKQEIIRTIAFDLEEQKTLSADVFNKTMDLSMHCICYRTELLRSIHYVQTEGISYTDTEWAILPLAAVRNLTFYKLHVYKYFIGREGQTVGPGNYLKYNAHLSKIWKKIISEAGISASANANAYIRNRIFGGLNMLYRIILMHGKEYDIENLKAFDDYIKQTDYYNLLEKAKLEERLPFCYIYEWRKKGKVSCRLKFYRLLYIMLLYCRKKKELLRLCFSAISLRAVLALAMNTI